MDVQLFPAQTPLLLQRRPCSYQGEHAVARNGPPASRQSSRSSHMRTERKKKEKNWEGKGESWSKREEERNPKYLLSSLVRLCWVLAGHVSRGAVSWLEGHRAKRTLVEDFAVFLMDVHFQHGEGHEDNSTMDAPGGCTKKEPNYGHSVDSNTHIKRRRWRQAPSYGRSSFSLFNSNMEE